MSEPIRMFSFAVAGDLWAKYATLKSRKLTSIADAKPGDLVMHFWVSGTHKYDVIGAYSREVLQEVFKWHAWAAASMTFEKWLRTHFKPIEDGARL